MKRRFDAKLKALFFIYFLFMRRGRKCGSFWIYFAITAPCMKNFCVSVWDGGFEAISHVTLASLGLQQAKSTVPNRHTIVIYVSVVNGRFRQFHEL